MEKINKLLKLDAFIYFLGYLWADGSVSKKGKSISLCIQEEDGKNIVENLIKIGDILQKPFSVNTVKPKKSHWKTMTRFYSGDKDLHEFLSKNDYLIKSLSPPEKILCLLPKDKHSLFYLGFFDGDGCVYNGEKTWSLYTFSFSGPFDYDWKFLENKFQELEIKSKIGRHKRTRGANSSITATGMFHVKKWSNYIYSDTDNVKFLERKRKKFEEIIKHTENVASEEKGVSMVGEKYIAHLTRNKKRLSLGVFDSEEEAIKIRKIALNIYEKLLSEFNTTS